MAVLVTGVGQEALLFKQAILQFQVEQCARRDPID